MEAAQENGKGGLNYIQNMNFSTTSYFKIGSFMGVRKELLSFLERWLRKIFR